MYPDPLPRTGRRLVGMNRYVGKQTGVYGVGLMVFAVLVLLFL